MAYKFELGIRAYPDSESINVNDTIWLEINEPTTLMDLNTRKEINYGNAANLGSAIAFQKLSGTNEFNVKAADQFNYRLIEGVETNNADPSALREYLFQEKNGLYLFKLGVIPKNSGTFRLFFSNAANVYRNNDNCTKAFFILNFKNTNQHIYLFPGLVDSLSGGGVYYFKVN